jgi:VIT1/CCC1 family predicted Fe2+/Mn2+ transporter
MIIRRRVYLMASLYLIALGGFLAGLAFFQFLPAGVGLMTSSLLALSTLAFAGAIIGLSRAFRE